jgi:hypothetical protein
VLVHRLNNFSYLFSIPSEYSTSQVADLLFREVFRLHGLLRYIISDHNIIFLNAFWQDMFSLSGIDLTPSTSYHPQIVNQQKICDLSLLMQR